jgi:hypothetical protein
MKLFWSQQADTELSSTMKYWLEERNLSSEEAQIIRLEEG